MKCGWRRITARNADAPRPAPVRRLLRMRAFVRTLLPLLLAAAGVRAELPPPLQKALDEAGVPASAVSLVVAPLQGGPRWLEHRADAPMQPGSTIKLVTTLVGLEQLGPAWRGRTRLLAAGPIREGVLHGDLVLQGQADMDLTWQALQALLQKARHRGLQEVKGALVLDRSFFRPTRTDRGLPPFDEAPEAAYNVVPDALLVDQNLLRLEVLADAQRGLQLEPITPLAGVRLVPEMVLVEGDCSRWDEGWKPPELRPHKVLRTLDVVLRGTWPLGCERTLALNLIDRDEFIGRMVRSLWTGLGGRWRGPVREGRAPSDAVLLAERQSRPLSELVRGINKASDNAMTRTLYLALGQAGPGDEQEATAARAEQAVRRWMRARGIDDAGLVIDNGSGLSRSERLTAAQLEAVVRAGVTGRWGPEFLSSLPIVGVDGTMRRRLTQGPAAGWARLKTGTLRNVVALAGTLPDAAGRPLVVVALFNHDGASPRQMRPVIDAWIDWVATQRVETR